jgi:hypothetical protein
VAQVGEFLIAMSPETELIDLYVRLLNEGTEVLRPAKALSLGSGVFRILGTPNYDPEDEEWEFKPGSLIRVESRVDQNGSCLVATRF